MRALDNVIGMLLAGLIVLAGASAAARGVLPEPPSLLWAVAASGSPQQGAAEPELSPEERFRRRFPQPVKVGDLIGLPVLDHSDSTLGRVQQVVRTPEGKVQLVMTYGGWFGLGGRFGWGGRLVAVPIEVVAILGRQIAALDMTRAEFDAAPTWVPSAGTPIVPAETIRIALGRR